MRAVALTTELTIALDFVAWLAIHLGAAWIGTKLPSSMFDREGWMYRQRGWEAGADVYARVLAVRSWKHLLPDGARFYRGGFPKRHLRDLSSGYLEAFLEETRRAEVTHYLAMLPTPLFFIWNPWAVGILMLFYAAATNLPCIIVQRYNRLRIARVLERRQLRYSTPPV